MWRSICCCLLREGCAKAEPARTKQRTSGLMVLRSINQIMTWMALGDGVMHAASRLSTKKPGRASMRPALAWLVRRSEGKSAAQLDCTDAVSGAVNQA